jgi:hypothetical protein
MQIPGTMPWPLLKRASTPKVRFGEANNLPELLVHPKSPGVGAMNNGQSHYYRYMIATPEALKPAILTGEKDISGILAVDVGGHTRLVGIPVTVNGTFDSTRTPVILAPGEGNTMHYSPTNNTGEHGLSLASQLLSPLTIVPEPPAPGETPKAAPPIPRSHADARSLHPDDAAVVRDCLAHLATLLPKA